MLPARRDLCAFRCLRYSCKQGLLVSPSSCKQPHSHRRNPLPPNTRVVDGCPGRGSQRLWSRCAPEKPSSSMRRRAACRPPVYQSHLATTEKKDDLERISFLKLFNNNVITTSISTHMILIPQQTGPDICYSYRIIMNYQSSFSFMTVMRYKTENVLMVLFTNE